MHDLDSKYYNLVNERIFYYLLSGKTYREIAQEYYPHDLNKFIYQVRKLREQLLLRNRRQLVYFAIVNNLIKIRHPELISGSQF